MTVATSNTPDTGWSQDTVFEQVKRAVKKPRKTRVKRFNELAHEPLTYFNQLDAFVNPAANYNSHTDGDGDELFGGSTWEFMSGRPGVRVLVDPGLDRDDAVRLLEKLTAWVREQHQPFAFRSKSRTYILPPLDEDAVLRRAAKHWRKDKGEDLPF